MQWAASDKLFTMFTFHFKLDFFHSIITYRYLGGALSIECVCVSNVFRLWMSHQPFNVSNFRNCEILRYVAPISTSEHKIVCNLCISMEHNLRNDRIVWINLNFIFFKHVFALLVFVLYSVLFFSSSFCLTLFTEPLAWVHDNVPKCHSNARYAIFK